MTITPTSAKMAAHIPAIPSAPSSRHSALMPSANTMFWCTMRRVRRAMRIASAIFAGSSSISTTSAASMAASEPSAPMAMPTSARDSTGASLMPSPTKARFSLGCFAASSFSIWSTLSPGKRPAWYSSRPSCCATACATGCASPVSMTVLRTPETFKARMASALWGFTTSEISR